VTDRKKEQAKSKLMENLAILIKLLHALFGSSKSDLKISRIAISQNND
jgi:hypothetical protein